MRKSAWIAGGLCLALAAGACAALFLAANRPVRNTVSLPTPPGRGQEPAWWEAIAKSSPPNAPVTYVVPADILFAVDSAIIDDGGRSRLRALVGNELQGVTSVVVVGHTDGTGTRQRNLELSQERADAAVHVLVEAGISSAIVRTEAWADERPVADEHGSDPSTARARNRRIEITVSKNS